jgi:hypothetical protein
MIIISPYSHVMPNGAKNPKTYPHWQKVVNQLKDQGKRVIQIGTHNEVPLVGAETFFGKPSRELIQLVNTCETWASVDNFFPHLCSHTKKSGVVIWSRSDPLIFGYPRNENLLKSRLYLRPDQFGKWTDCSYMEEAFIDPSVVVNAIMAKCN